MSQPPTDKIAEDWLIGDKTLGITSVIKIIFLFFFFFFFFPEELFTCWKKNRILVINKTIIKKEERYKLRQCTTVAKGDGAQF